MCEGEMVACVRGRWRGENHSLMIEMGDERARDCMLSEQSVQSVQSVQRVQSVQSVHVCVNCEVCTECACARVCV